jgi:hypothetical protein
MLTKPRPNAAAAAITTIRIEFSPWFDCFAPIGNLSPPNRTADEQITTSSGDWNRLRLPLHAKEAKPQ